jgi:hypothetical protein
MSDLGTRLRAYVDDLVETLPDLDSTLDAAINWAHGADVRPVPGVEPRRRLGGPRLALGALLVALAVGALSWVLLSTHETRATGTNGPWTRVSDPAVVFSTEPFVEEQPSSDGSSVLHGSSGIVLAAVAVSPDTVVAVGHEQIGLHEIGAIWYSEDRGRSWKRVSDDPLLFGGVDQPVGDVIPTGVSVTDVAFGHGRFVAAGVTQGSEATFWYSDDGASWSLADTTDGQVPEGRLAQVHVVAGDSGFVAAGTLSGQDPRTEVWLSADGTQWTVVPNAIPAVFITLDVSVVDETIVVSGALWSSSGTTTPEMWMSTDGASWAPVDPPFSPTPPSHWSQIVVTVVATDHGVVAIGGESGDPRQGSDLIVWLSSDMTSWERTDSVDLTAHGTWAPFAAGYSPQTGLVVFGTDNPTDTRVFASAAWISTDMLRWKWDPALVDGVVLDVARLDGSLIAIGAIPAIGSDDADSGAVWLSVREDTSPGAG